MALQQAALLAILISLSLCSKAQQPVTKGQQQVQQTVISFFEALSNRDSVSLKNYCTADIVLYENGSAWNADTLILKAIKLNTATDFKRVNTIGFIATTVHKNIAWASYNLQSEVAKNNKHTTILWMETVIAVKKHKQWKIKVLHSTLIKRTGL